jgi:hypothetical protein
VNIFPVGGAVPTGTAHAGRYMTTIHESDPKFATARRQQVQVLRHRHDEGRDQLADAQQRELHGVVPAWLTTCRSRARAGRLAQTKEFSKIIPDGLLTPGSHVQYFFRKSHAADPNLNYSMCPDTNCITPQPRRSSTDQHRWQQFACCRIGGRTPRSAAPARRACCTSTSTTAAATKAASWR